MHELPAFIDARNARDWIVEYGATHGWKEARIDECLQWFGLGTRYWPREWFPHARDIGVSVYVIAVDHPGSEEIKVGISQNVESRRLSLESEKQRNLMVAHVSEKMFRWDARRIEQWSHALLGEWEIGSEWFSCGVERAIAAVIACGGDRYDVV